MNSLRRCLKAVQIAAITILIGIVSSQPAHAISIRYVATLTVEDTNVWDTPAPYYNLSDLARPPFVGQQYYIYLTTDDSILASDGANPGEILHINAVVGDTTWSFEQPPGTTAPFWWHPSFVVRGVPGCGIAGCDTPHLGFYVQNGEVTGLYGYFFAGSDTNGVDFGPQQFHARAYYACLPAEFCAGMVNHGYTQLQIAGSLSLARLPEPGTLALLTLCLAGLGITRRRSA